MPASASHSRSAFQGAELNVPRIAAISATLCVHITASPFLMVPVSLPEKVVPSSTVTQIVLRDPPKPEPVVLPPKPLLPKPVQTRQNPLPQTAMPRTSAPADATQASVAESLVGHI